MSDGKEPTNTGINGQSTPIYDIAAPSLVPPQPVIYAIHPSYQYGPPQPQSAETVPQPGYLVPPNFLPQLQTGQPGPQPGFMYAVPQPQNVPPVQQPQTTQPVHQPVQHSLSQQPQPGQAAMSMGQPPPKEAPGQMSCPRCNITVISTIRYKRGILSWALCSVLFALLCWPCFWIPLVAEACMDVEHSCPICRTVLHVYKRK